MVGAGIHKSTSKVEFEKGFVNIEPPNYFICGKWAYSWLPLSSHGRCTVATLAPAITVVDEGGITATKYLLSHNNLFRRALFQEAEYAWAWFPSWTGWGVELLIRLNIYAGLIDKMFNETAAAITANSVEIAQVRRLSLNKKLALDYILAEQGGMCQVIRQ